MPPSTYVIGRGQGVQRATMLNAVMSSKSTRACSNATMIVAPDYFADNFTSSAP